MCIIFSMKKKKYTAEQRSTLFVSVLTSFITTFMGSALNLSVPDIEKDFGVSAAAACWLVTVYMLTCAALAVPFGRIADIMQKKTLLWIGILIFAISSAAAVISSSMWMLLVFRFGQGVGGSMIFSTNMAILVGAFEKESRGKVLGYSTGATYIGLSAGPVLGGVFNYNFGWKSIFIAAAAVSAAAFYGAFKKLPPEKKNADGVAQGCQNIDIKGSVLYVLAIASIMYGLSSAATSETALLILAAGAVLMIAFFQTELVSPCPVIEITMFKNNIAYVFSNMAALLNYGATFAVSYLMSIYLQVITGYNSQTAGLFLISSPLTMALLSPVAGRLSDRYSPYAMSSLGMGICAAALAMLAFLPQDAGIARIILILVISGVGVSLFTSPNTNAVMASADKQKYGIASSVLATMRSTGHTVSMAVVTGVTGMYMGAASVYEADTEAVMKTVHTCFFIFAGLCIVGIFIASRRKS